MGFVVWAIEVDSIPAPMKEVQSVIKHQYLGRLLIHSRRKERIDADASSTILVRQVKGVSSSDAHRVRLIEHLRIVAVIAAEQVHRTLRSIGALFSSASEHAESLVHESASPAFSLYPDIEGELTGLKAVTFVVLFSGEI
jgi:hypothetical protein